MAVLIRAPVDPWLASILAHDVGEELDAPGLRQAVHAVHLAEGEDVSVVLQGDHAPVLHLVVASDDAPDVEAPDAVVVLLVVAQLAERYA